MDQITGPECRRKTRAPLAQAGRMPAGDRPGHSVTSTPRARASSPTAHLARTRSRTHEAQPPQAAPASCESEEPEYVDGGANEDEDAVVDEGGDGLA